MSQLEEGASLFHMVAKENEHIQVSSFINGIPYPKLDVTFNSGIQVSKSLINGIPYTKT